MRQQVNLITEALRTSNSGATAPTPTVAGMLWYDTSVTPGILYQRNNANDAWVAIAAADGSVTNAKLANMATARIKGRVTAGTGAPEDLTVTQVQTMLGIVPGGGDRAGEVAWYAANTAPTGTLKANGAAVSRSTYAALFAVIGTTFGVGNGSTTFNVPDMRGEFARGWDDGRGIDTGRAFGSAQTDAFQGHGHTLRGSVNRSNNGNFNEFGDVTHSYSNTTSVQGPTTFGSFGAVRTANETRPRNIALLAVIFF